MSLVAMASMEMNIMTMLTLAMSTIATSITV